MSDYFSYNPDKLSKEELDVTLNEAVEYVESLGVKISLNGIGLDVIKKLADLLKESEAERKRLQIKVNDLNGY